MQVDRSVVRVSESVLCECVCVRYALNRNFFFFPFGIFFVFLLTPSDFGEEGMHESGLPSEEDREREKWAARRLICAFVRDIERAYKVLHYSQCQTGLGWIWLGVHMYPTWVHVCHGSLASCLH